MRKSQLTQLCTFYGEQIRGSVGQNVLPFSRNAIAWFSDMPSKSVGSSCDPFEETKEV